MARRSPVRVPYQKQDIVKNNTQAEFIKTQDLNPHFHSVIGQQSAKPTRINAKQALIGISVMLLLVFSLAMVLARITNSDHKK